MNNLFNRFAGDRSKEISIKYGLVAAVVAIAILAVLASLPGLGATFDPSTLS